MSAVISVPVSISRPEYPRLQQRVKTIVSRLSRGISRRFPQLGIHSFLHLSHYGNPAPTPTIQEVTELRPSVFLVLPRSVSLLDPFSDLTM
jgi:hypothetical protein